MVDTQYDPTLENRLRRIGCQVDRFEHLIPALRAFDTRIYDAIILNTVVAPGLIRNQDHETIGYYVPGSYDNDQRIKEIMEEYKIGGERTRSPDYWKLAMYAIEVAHRPRSPNARTPIFVAGNHEEEGDLSFPNAKETSRTAGAIDYYDLDNDERFEAVIRDIRKLTS